MSNVLPAAFVDLEPFAGWSLPTERERYAKRLDISFPVEAWHQPRVPDSGASTLDCTVEPAI